MFWKRKQNQLIIQCPHCEWRPDGGKHWGCSCGHLWNTFKTKAKCPKCEIQWENTSCIVCGKSSPHSDWYITPTELDRIESSGDQRLRAIKKRLESRLIQYGIKYYRVSDLAYLDHSKEKFHSAYDAGCRMMILYAIGEAAHNLNERERIIQWFKEENIWGKVSPQEKNFLTQKDPHPGIVANMSWRVQSALTLGWCLKMVKSLPALDKKVNGKGLSDFYQKLPTIGESLGSFLTGLSYRDLDEIYAENRLNELVTTYFRDLMFNGKKDKTRINRFTSFERHEVLNWLRSKPEQERRSERHV